MSNKISESLINQLDEVIITYKKLRNQSKYDDFSDLKGPETNKLITRARAAVERISGSKSVYTKQIEAAIDRFGSSNPYNIPILGGIVEALKEDLQAGYLVSLQELIHADLFSDFLEMSTHLINEGYKDASAVIAGSALEAHLRQLCIKNSIDIEFKNSKGGVNPKKADRLNSDLAKEEVYSKLDQKSITSWLDLRNKAAHGKYDEYVHQQVSIMITGIRDFITRVPA